jgi:DnaJ-domain-containing protein 1
MKYMVYSLIYIFDITGEVCAKHDDLHAILGVSKNADKAEIKRAYYKLAKEHHPDKVGKSSSAERQFAKITKAYDVSTMPSCVNVLP